ncbi:MAG: TetR family transcriptional regulator [Dehalococcoidia bacterium]|nr:TetR family transcriptional regulator [Dehalococcoidia bacterium]
MSRPKNKAKKNEIMAKAANLFWQRGYESTTLNDIAAVCHCQAANLYNYFRSKEHLLYEVFKSEIANIINTGNEAASSNLPSSAKLKLLIQGYLQHAAGLNMRLLVDLNMKNLSRTHYKKIINMRDTYDKIVDGILEEGIRQGEFADIDVRVIRNIIIGINIRTWIWFSPKGELSLQEIGDIIYSLVFNGIKAATISK